MINRRGAADDNPHIKQQSKPQRTRNPRLALEPRIVFDGAGAASGADVYSVDAVEHYAQDSLFVPPAVREVAAVVKRTVEAPAPSPRNTDPVKDSNFPALTDAAQNLEPAQGESAKATVTVASQSTEVIFVDASVKDMRAFLNGKSGEVIILDANRDGVEQIAEALAGRKNVTAVHVLSHGEAGQLRLGNATLTQASMEGEHADELATIKASLSSDADILIYGCNFGEGEFGSLATDALAARTGADVAASTDVTGHRDLGGNWVLERTTGDIEAAIALDERGQNDYYATLAPLVIVANTPPVVVPSGGPTIVGTVATYNNVGTVNGVAVMLRATVTSVAAGDTNDTIVFTRNGTQPRIELSGNADNATLSVRWEILDQATGLVATPADFSIAVNDIDGPNLTEAVSSSTDFGLTSYAVDTPTNLIVTTANNRVTATGTQNENSGPTSAIRFSWANVPSVDFVYRTGAPGTRFFDHDGSGVVVFTNPVATQLYVLDLDANNSSLSAGNNFRNTFTENGAAVNIVDSDVVVASGPSMFTGGTVTLTNAGAGDQLLVSGQPFGTGFAFPSGIVASVNTSVIGQITVLLSGTATPANYLLALQAITFRNSTDTPSAVDRTVQVGLVNGANFTNVPVTTIRVVPVNDPPVAVNDLANTPINTALNAINVIGNDVDLDGNPLTITLATMVNPALGTVTVVGNKLNFTPALNVTGTVVINYAISDGNGGTSNATLTVFIGPNTLPDSANQTFSTPEDTPLTLGTGNFTFTDPDVAQSLANVRIDTVPGNGILRLNGLTVTAGQIISAADIAAGKVTFVPALNASGAPYTTFTFSVQDSAGAFDAVPNTLTFNVTPVADAPVNTAPLAQTSLEDSPFPISGVSVADVDSASLSAIVSVTNGTLSVATSGGGTITNNGTASVTMVGTAAQINAALAGLTFNNTGDYNGTAVLTLATSDGTLTDTDTVNIAITPVTDIANDSVTTALNTAVTISVLANDSFENAGRTITAVAGIAITAGGASVPVTNGSVALNAAGQLIFTPTTGFLGTVPTFTYTVTSGGVTETANVNVDVSTAGTPVNTVPGARVTTEDTALAITGISVADSNSANLTTTVSIPIATGILTLPTGGGGTFTTNGTASVTVTGTIAQVNAALAGLIYSSTAASNTADFNGSTTLTVFTTDGALSDTNTVAITVNPVADIVGDILTTPEDTAITANLITGTSGASADNFEGASAAITAVTQGAKGTVTFVPATGSVTYTPNLNFNGADSFTYTVTSGGVTETATVFVTVTSVNDVPVAVADTATTAEDTAVAITAASLLSNDTGLGDGPVTVTSVQAPVNGTVSLAAGVITFTPNANYNGPASFTYTITDSNGDTSTATVNITVTSVNDVPVAVADTVTVTEDIPFTSVVQLDANDTDLDGNALTVVPGTFTTSAGGSIVIAADGSYVYTPPLNFNGTDTVNYTVTDGSLTDIGQLTLNVSPANDPPVNTVPGAQSAVENAPFAIPGLSVTDLDGNLATTQLSVNNGTVTIGNLNGATILAGTNGTSTLTLSGTETQINAALATLSYQGNLNFSGPDVLTVLSTDSAGTALTDTDTVSITVGAQPIFSINDVTVNEGAGTITFTVTKSGATALTTTVNYAVAPNSAVTPGDYAAGTSALTGTLSFAPGVTTQTIVLNIADDAVFELAETFNVNLSAPTNAAIADSLGVGTITDNDAAPSFAINDVSVSESAGTITFTVTKTAATDVASSVTYTAADGSATAPGDYTAGTNPLSGVLNFAAGVTSQTIVLNITNDAVAELTETFNVDLSAAVNATISDSLGVATIADDEGAPTFSINDVTVNEGAGTITFTVTKSGTTALTTTVDYAVAPNSAVTPGDYAAGTSALTGTLSFASGVTTRTIVLNITNDAVFELAESFNVNLSAPINATIADSLGVGTITDNDAAPNTPPVATADLFATNEDAGLTLSPVALLGNDIDANGDPLVLLSVQSATNGTVALIGGNIVFTPAPNYSGPASFAYTISDNNGGTSTATVSVNVLPVNDSPVANGDSAGSTAEDTPVSVSASSLLGNDSDPDGDLLTVASVQSGVGGTVSLAGGVITFTPNQNFNGPASFTYTVSDGNGGFATATVTVNVTAVNDAPVASDDSVSTNEDQPLTLTSATLLGNDVDVDGDSLTIVSVQSPANGTVSLVNGLMVFTPVANYNGPASLVYTVTDSQGSTSTATVNIAVISVNDAPLSVDDLAPDTFEDVPLTLSAADLLSNDSDVDFDKLLIASVQNPTNGTVQIVGGNIVFIPAPGYDGPASFTYTVVDGKGGTSTARVELKILGVNNPAFQNSNFSSTDHQRPNVPEFTTVADPALHVLFSVTEVRASVELRGNRGLFQTDGATFAELTSGFRADLTFAEGNQFGSRGLGGTRNNSTARDTNAVFVRQAVTYQSLGLENGLYVHDAVYASQLESSARSIRIASFNSAVPGVPNLLDGFSLGSPVSLTGAQQTGEVTNAQNMPIPDILNGLIDQAADCVPCSSSPASETSAVATFPIHPRISRGADSFAAQLQRNAEAFKTRSTPVANRVAGISQVRV